MSPNNQTERVQKKRRRLSLTNIIFIHILIIVTVSMIAIGTYSIIRKIQTYNHDVSRLRTEFPMRQKNELKFRVLEAKEYINWVVTYPEKSINSHLPKLSMRYARLMENSKISKTGSSYFIPQKIKDTLNYANLNCVIKMAVYDSAFQPVYLPELNDLPGEVQYMPLIEKTISAIKKEKSETGFYPAIRSISEKSGYAAMASVNNGDFWVAAVFSGNDPGKALQEIVLDSLSRVKFEDNEYFIINSADGNAYLTRTIWDKDPKNILTGDDENWKKIFRNELLVARHPGGGYILYNWKRKYTDSLSTKISYFTGISQWNWIIGTGKHLDALIPLLEKEKNQLRAEIRADILSKAIFAIIIFAFIIFLVQYFSRMISSNLRHFNLFFQNAVHGNQHIDEESIHFREFGSLARSANLMIEEREKMRAILAEQQSRLRNIIDSVPDLIFFKDTDSRFLGCNKAFEKFVGKKEAEIIGKTEFDLFTPAQAEMYLASDKHLMLTGEIARNKEWNRLKEGYSILLDTLKTIYRDEEGKILGIIAISRDVTEMEETRQRLVLAKNKAEESDRLKTAFLANMSHEIRTPMNAIIGFSDLLADDDLTPEEKQDFIAKIKLSGENLMNLINDIIDIAKIEAGQLKIMESTCNVGKLLETLHGTFSEIRNQQKKNAIELRCYKEPDEGDLIIITDPLRLQQVLTNLIGNALKFTEQGYIEFGCKRKNGFLEFFIKDTGIGIPQDKHDILFQRFSQVDASKTRKFGGTGLGLAISKNIVELLGGSIWFESEAGQGSTFYFTIPYKPSSGGELANSSKRPATDYDWSDKTILVAEDIDENFMLIEAAFRRTGAKLIHACDGLAAVNEAKSNDSIDLILMDIQLPIMTGYEAIRNILIAKPDMPIISYTAYALANEREKSIAAGCVDYIAKPIRHEVILPIINKYLKPGT